VLDLEGIREAGLGGVLAVNQGSVEEPRFVTLTYEPADPVATIALVGKGVTFDSGGLSIKPADAMTTMKCDMAGAAAVVATVCAAARLAIPVKVVGYTPMTDNMTGGAAQRPGDVYVSKHGTTVEVLNTDAEGRLILADALAVASAGEPDAIVDLATLTGACMVALGDRYAGVMATDDGLSGAIIAAAAEAGELVWPLPLPAQYRRQLDSQVADIKNVGTRYGGALTAGLFLKEFVGAGIPWVHLDIAGPAFAEAADADVPQGGTGFGVRTLLQWLIDRSAVAGESAATDTAATSKANA
jgi:leucyl aminopeptidase